MINVRDDWFESFVVRRLIVHRMILLRGNTHVVTLTCWLTGLVRSASADTASPRMETRLTFIVDDVLLLQEEGKNDFLLANN
jgi:hypothetical protein